VSFRNEALAYLDALGKDTPPEEVGGKRDQMRFRAAWEMAGERGWIPEEWVGARRVRFYSAVCRHLSGKSRSGLQDTVHVVAPTGISVEASFCCAACSWTQRAFVPQRRSEWFRVVERGAAFWRRVEALIAETASQLNALDARVTPPRHLLLNLDVKSSPYVGPLWFDTTGANRLFTTGIFDGGTKCPSVVELSGLGTPLSAIEVVPGTWELFVYPLAKDSFR
jgi:hypothetical protein